jgi:hypothetical protein
MNSRTLQPPYKPPPKLQQQRQTETHAIRTPPFRSPSAPGRNEARPLRDVIMTAVRTQLHHNIRDTSMAFWTSHRKGLPRYHGLSHIAAQNCCAPTASKLSGQAAPRRAIPSGEKDGPSSRSRHSPPGGSPRSMDRLRRALLKTMNCMFIKPLTRIRVNHELAGWALLIW